MSEQRKTVNLDDKEFIFHVTYNGIKTSHYLREHSPEEWLEYRRRVSRYTAKKGRVEATDEAIKAPWWLYDQLTVRVEGFEHSGQDLMIHEAWKKLIPIPTKEVVVAAYLSRVDLEEDDGGN